MTRPDPGRIVVSVIRERDELAISTTWIVTEDQAAVIGRLLDGAGSPASHAMVPLAALARLAAEPGIITDE